jgi:type II secretory pathway component PulF
MDPPFTFRAVDRAGRRTRGVELAPSATALAQALEARGLLVLDITPAEDRSAPAALGGTAPRQADVLEFTRALAALLAAGLPLARALAIAGSLSSAAMNATAQAVLGKVERGAPLSSAIAEYPRTFSPVYLGLIRAGDRSGDLSGAFRRLTAYLERDAELRSRLVSASLYPLILGASGAVAVTVLVLFVLPKFAEVLQDAGASLPRSTAFLLAGTSLVERLWPLAAVVAIGALLGLAWCRTSEQGRRALARLGLLTPGIRQLRRLTLGARFSRLLAVLLGGGAPVLAALDETAECLTDPLARAETTRIRARVREGASLSSALRESELFPLAVCQLAAVGEESARLEEFLGKAADALEEAADRALRRVVALAEPALILLFGGIVGFVALSLLQAVYGVNAGAFR